MTTEGIVALVAVLSLASAFVAVVVGVVIIAWRLGPYAVPVLRYIASAHAGEVRRLEAHAARAGRGRGPVPPAVDVARPEVSEEDLREAESVVLALRRDAERIAQMSPGSDRDAANKALAQNVEKAQPLVVMLQRAGRMP